MKFPATFALVFFIGLVSCDSRTDENRGEIERDSSGVPSSAPHSPEVANAAPEDPLAALIADGSSVGWVGTMRDLYPDDYRLMANKIAAISRSGADINAAKTAGMSEVAPFMAARKSELIHASDANLVEYIKLNTAALRVLREDSVRACNDVPRGTLSPTEDLSQASFDAMSAATSQLLIAANAASRHPTQRAANAPTADEVGLWRESMTRAGATPTTFASMSAGREALSPAQQCDIRILMMEGILGLPAPLAAKFSIHLLAR